MLRAVVIGANGFLGHNLVAELARSGWEVHAQVRPGALRRQLGALAPRIFESELADARMHARWPERPDAIFLAAGSTEFWRPAWREQHLCNVVGARLVAEAARRAGARRLLLTSSAAAYGLHAERVTESTARCGARSSIGYVRTKALAELEVERGGVDHVILQPTTMIGAYDHKLWPAIVGRLRRGRLRVVSPGRTSFAGAAEVARAHALAFERANPGERYLLGGPDATFLEVVQRIAARVGAPAPAQTTPVPLLRAAARLMDAASRVAGRAPPLTPDGLEYLLRRNVVGCEKACAELGYRPPDLERLVDDLVEWTERRRAQ